MREKKEAFLSKILFALLWAVPIATMFQGVEPEDAGYYLSSAERLFSPVYPEITVSPYTLLSNIINNLYLRLFDRFGLLAMSFLNSLLCVALAYISYKMTKPRLGRLPALTGALLAELLFLNFTHVPSYNTYGVLLMTLSGYFLYFGMTEDKNRYFALGGLFMAAGIACRVPDIAAAFLFIAALGYWCAAEKKKISYFMKTAAIYTGSLSLGLLVIFAGYLLLDKFTALNISFFDLAGMADGEASYALRNLLYGYFVNALDFLSYLYIPLLIFVACAGEFLCAKCDNRLVRVLIRVLDIALILFAFFVFVFKNVYIQVFMAVFSWIVAYIAFLVSHSEKRRDTRLALLCVIGVILSAAPCIGSNTGITHAKLSCGVLMAVAVYALYALFKAVPKTRYLKWFYRGVAIAAGLLVVFYGLVLCTCYYEAPNRLAVRYTINTEKAKGVFTSKVRAEMTNRTLEALGAIDNDYLISFPRYKIIYYLSGKKPYFGELGVGYEHFTLKEFKNRLHAHEKDILPIILFTKIEPRKYEKADLAHEKGSLNPEKTKILMDFIARHDYDISYDDEYVVVYTP